MKMIQATRNDHLAQTEKEALICLTLGFGFSFSLRDYDSPNFSGNYLSTILHQNNLMKSRQDISRVMQKFDLYTVISRHCSNKDRIIFQDGPPSFNICKHTLQFFKGILSISPSLDQLGLQVSEKYREEFMNISGIKDFKSVQGVMDFFADLRTLSYSPDIKALSQTVDAIIASPYRGEVNANYFDRFLQTDVDILSRLKNPLTLELNMAIPFSNTMGREMLRLSPILKGLTWTMQRTQPDDGDFENLDYFVEVLNNLKELDLLRLNSTPFTLQLSLLKSSIKTLQINRMFLDPATLATILTNNPSIHSLRLQTCMISDSHFAVLPHLPNILTLSLFEHQSKLLTCTGVKCIVQKCTNLVDLELNRYNTMGNRALKEISTLRGLERLVLPNCGFTSSGLIYLKNLKNLREIELNFNNTTFPVFISLLKNMGGVRLKDKEWRNLRLQDDDPKKKRAKESVSHGLCLRIQ